MINFLSVENRIVWWPILRNKFKEHISLLDMSIELIENRILRNELLCFEINQDLYILGNIFQYGNDRVFFVYFLTGKYLKKNIIEMFEYVKDRLGCNKVDFHFKGESRRRLYNRILNNKNTQYRMYCNITL